MREREGGELLLEEAMEGGRDGERDGDRERDPTKQLLATEDLTFAECMWKCAAPASNKIWRSGSI